MTFEDFAYSQHNHLADDSYTATDEIYNGMGAALLDYNGCFPQDEDPADYNRKTLSGWRR